MKINLAKSSGFCFGVKRALQIARKTAESKDNVYMLGDIVHNVDVVNQIKQAGIKKINKLIPLPFGERVRVRGRNRILLIRAHGAAKKTFAQAKTLGYETVDATCTMVKEIHRIVQDAQRKGYRIIIIGDKNHDEVQGIVGQLKHQAIVIDSSRYISTQAKALKEISKAAVVVQSTQNIEKVLKIVQALKGYIKELKFFNTICQPTKTKQEEIKTMSQHNDLMIIIGSKTSANTKRLYEISKALNRQTYWVQSKDELKRKWFKAVNSVGISAGASTPNATTHSVIHQIRDGSA